MRSANAKSVERFLRVFVVVVIVTPFAVPAIKATGPWQSAERPPAPGTAQTDRTNQAPARDSVQNTSDACSLLSKSEIEKVQGERVKETKASQGKAGAVIVSQCFYVLPTSSNSISLALTLPDPANSSQNGPRDLWKEWFQSKTAPDKQPKSNTPPQKETEEEARAQAVPVPRLGDDAYWVRSFTGTLYVLKQNSILRISIGGKQDDSLRLQKAQALAKDALRQML